MPRLPYDWRPPLPFEATVSCVDRPPVVLWVTPWSVDDAGRVVLYHAYGPAGESLVPGASLNALLVPQGARIQLVVDQDGWGRIVYLSAQQTMN